jgi:hypothetical protein
MGAVTGRNFFKHFELTFYVAALPQFNVFTTVGWLL